MKNKLDEFINFILFILKRKDKKYFIFSLFLLTFMIIFSIFLNILKNIFKDFINWAKFTYSSFSRIPSFFLKIVEGKISGPSEIRFFTELFPFESNLKIICFAYSFIMILSFIIHFPVTTTYKLPFNIFGIPLNGVYSDIVAIFFRDGIGKSYLGFPYINYNFEYPVLIGMLIFIASFISWNLSSPIIFGVDNALIIFYFINSLALYLAGLLLVVDLYYLAKKVKVEWTNVLIFVGLPSLLIYGIYNWDLISIAFGIHAIKLFIEKKYVQSAFFLSLGIAAKLLPIFIMFALVREFLFEKLRFSEKFLKILSFSSLTISLFILYNLPFIFLNFNLWYETYNTYYKWFIEGSWLVLFYENPYKHNAQIVSLSLVLTFIPMLLIATSLKKYKIKEQRVIETSWLLISAAIFSNYIHTPQMQILILPLLMLQGIFNYFLIFIFDFLNALVILTLFNYKELSILLFNYEPTGTWFHRDALPTIFAIIRDFILFSFILVVLFKKRT